MSGITGKNTSTAFRKKDVAESRLLSIGFKKIRFMHKAAEGDTLIQLASLTTPTEATANGFVQPSVSDLTKTDIYLFKENVELESTIRGKLTQFLSYVITGPSTIKLLFEAEENEIFTGIIDLSARTGNTLVDAEPLVSTGSLDAGETDFNVGTPFKVGMFPNAQHGAVMVFLDNQLVYRNSGNNPPGDGVDGEYYEVHAGGGEGQIIRFNTPDLVNDRNVTVISVGSLVERPNGSQLALVEAIQGQVTTLREYVQALVGEEVTVPVSAPTNVDLKTFGDDVFTLKKILDQEVEIRKIAFLKDVKSNGTDAGGFTSGSYVTRILNTEEDSDAIVSLSSNQFTLSEGKYLIEASAPAYDVGRHKAKIRNITDSSDAIIGTSEASSPDTSTTVTSSNSLVSGIIEINSPKVFELQHRCSISQVTNGLGLASNYGDNEVYAVVKITKIEKKTIREWLGL